MPSGRKSGKTELVKPILTIGVVAVVMILLVYSVYSGLKTQLPPTKPIVTFTGTSIAGTDPNITVNWTVAGASEEFPFSAYRIQLLMDGVPRTATGLHLSANVIMSFDVARAVVNDSDGDGKLSGGDGFMVYGMSSGRTWAFYLIWDADSDKVRPHSWST